MEPLEIITRWIWKPESFHCRVIDIRGGQMPPQVRNELIHSSPPDDFNPSFHRMGQAIAEYIGQNLPDPEPIDIGGERQIHGQVTEIQLLDSRTSENPDSNYISYDIEYANGHRTEASVTYRLDDFPEFVQNLIKQLHRDTNKTVKEWFWSQFGQGEVNPQKWKASKLEIFISHRAKDIKISEELFDRLGEYQNSTIFLPRIDVVDLQAGNWMDQLMSMIDRCSVFIPVLSRDYLSGPFSRPELDQAMRQSFSHGNKRIIPVLIEGTPDDYSNHFLGGFQMVPAQDGLSQQLIDKVAHLALGISRNRFE